MEGTPDGFKETVGSLLGSIDGDTLRTSEGVFEGIHEADGMLRSSFTQVTLSSSSSPSAGFGQNPIMRRDIGRKRWGAPEFKK